MALLLVFGSITIDASDVYTYTYYVKLSTGGYQIWYSDKAISRTSGAAYIFDPNTGTSYELNYTSNRYQSAKATKGIIASYNGVEWLFSFPCYEVGGTGNISAVYWGPTQTISSMSSTMPDSFPEPPSTESVEDIINNELNSTTIVSTQANVYVNNINNVYNSYVLGNTSLDSAKEQVQENLDNLSELANEPTATLKDAVNVTNALTYGQTVNDTLLQEQEEEYWNQRDIDTSVSQNIQQSDQEEIDYLEDLIAETEKSISELSPSENFTAQQIETATEIIDGIWENPIIKKIIPLAACFMVVCVVLGVKYRI